MKAAVAALLLAAAAFGQTPVYGPSSSGSGGGASSTSGLSDVGAVTVSYSATPTFDASAGNIFALTLEGGVTSSTLSGETPGQAITLRLTQDVVGDHPFVYPAEVVGGCSIATTAGATTIVQMTVVSASETNVTYCGDPAGPDALVFTAVAPGAVETPAAGKRTLFFDSANGDAATVKKSDASTVVLEPQTVVLASSTTPVNDAAAGGAWTAVTEVFPAGTFLPGDQLGIDYQYGKSGTAGTWQCSVFFNGLSNFMDRNDSMQNTQLFRWAQIKLGVESTSAQTSYGVASASGTLTYSQANTWTQDLTSAVTIYFRCSSGTAGDTRTLFWYRIARTRP